MAFEPHERILDAGCGVGVVALALACLRGARAVTGVELQEELVALARDNCAANGAEGRVTITAGDLRHLPEPMRGAFDVVCANPPFREVGAGRLNPTPGKACARHELTLTLAELAAAAATALGPGGRLYLIHQPRRLAAVLAALADAGFAAERLRFVQPRAAEAANLFLLAARRGGKGEMSVLPPLVVYGADGRYGAEVAAVCAGEDIPLYEPAR